MSCPVSDHMTTCDESILAGIVVRASNVHENTVCFFPRTSRISGSINGMRDNAVRINWILLAEIRI